MVGIFRNIETSFKAATRGEETVQNMVYYWGLIGYLIAFFIVNKTIRLVHSYYFGLALSIPTICYFAWHFYALRKCTPKKPKLTPEEKKKLREERHKDLGRKILRKLFLQESVTKWDPVFMCLVVDVFCIAQFLDYVIR